jgi:hypothetical protein
VTAGPRESRPTGRDLGVVEGLLYLGALLLYGRGLFLLWRAEDAPGW